MYCTREIKINLWCFLIHGTRKSKYFPNSRSKVFLKPCYYDWIIITCIPLLYTEDEMQIKHSREITEGSNEQAFHTLCLNVSASLIKKWKLFSKTVLTYSDCENTRKEPTVPITVMKILKTEHNRDGESIILKSLLGDLSGKFLAWKGIQLQYRENIAISTRSI